MGRRKGCTNSPEHTAKIRAKAQENAYWTKLFNGVRRAADEGNRRQAIHELDVYLRVRRESGQERREANAA
jgi:hypothetical protein